MTKNDSIVAAVECRTIPTAFAPGVRAAVPITSLTGNFNRYENAGFHERLLLALYDGFPESWKNPPHKTTT